MKAPRIPRVLLVEDEPGDTRLMQLAMKNSGFQLDLHCVGDGHEAIEYLTRLGQKSRNAVHPDLILLDLKMPGQSGLETLRAIKQLDSLRAIPVVVVTTSGLEADVVAAYHLGAAGYVAKPADLNEFMEAIRLLGTYWFKLVRLPDRTE
ncbi:Response regulator [Gammaproteobacteria bacterium]